MSLRHANEPVNPRKRGRSGGRVPDEAGNVASVLALQRSIGNAATRQLMRDAKLPDRFKVVIVPDGETGLSKAAVTKAVQVVKNELATVASGSHDATLRKGFTVDYRDSDGDLEGLHKRVFLVYLMQDRDADHAVRLARPHMPPRSDSMLKEGAHELNAIGGANLRIDFNGRSPSVSFASTGALADFVKDRDGGDHPARDRPRPAGPPHGGRDHAGPGRVRLGHARQAAPLQRRQPDRDPRAARVPGRALNAA
jgi:hypothetical protein